MKKRNRRNVLSFHFAIFLITSSIILTIFLTGFAQAELVDNGGGLIYDTDLDITWYVPSVDQMTWSEAVSWVAGLSVSNENGSNIMGWRLPSVLNEDGTGPCNRYNCIESEFGYLYYMELGNVPGGPIMNKGPFSNLNAGVYWSSLQWKPYPGNAWVFSFSTGLQGFADKNLYANYYPMAVHDGNVGGSVQLVRTPKHTNMTEAMDYTQKTTLRITEINK
jgi:hypothetical protein